MKRLVELTNILQQSTRYSHFLHTLDRSSCLATITGASLGLSVRLTVKSSELFPRDDQGMKTKLCPYPHNIDNLCFRHHQIKAEWGWDSSVRPHLHWPHVRLSSSFILLSLFVSRLTVSWREGRGWGQPRIGPHTNLSLSPASKVWVVT